ncbi:endoglucanase A [Acrasis kona]|uniref:Endoglucanase A n=1 Tax=Acrasis kona TaxID=1008807 RepID=A0AAW2ZNA7_9EUKA
MIVGGFDTKKVILIIVCERPTIQYDTNFVSKLFGLDFIRINVMRMTNRIEALYIIILVVTFISGQSLKGLHVSGNRILNDANQQVRLIGVNRAGAEYMCVLGYGIFDGPTDQGSLDAIKSWGFNTIRIPLNEDCWLNINGIKPEFAGDNYKYAIKNFVDLITNNGMAVILDLHWTANGGKQAKEQAPMPNLDHSLAFWNNCAGFFKDYSNVIFDAFNEPFPGKGCSDCSDDRLWQCWREGGNDCFQFGLDYPAAGMNQIVNAIRSGGAGNIIMLGGLAWSNALTGWLKFRPSDNNLAASWHSYNFNFMIDEDKWNQYIGPTASQVPVIVGELGPKLVVTTTILIGCSCG